jgi:hypothetical protein
MAADALIALPLYPSLKVLSFHQVVDFNNYHPGEHLVDNTLWIVESIPGRIASKDMTWYFTILFIYSKSATSDDSKH